MPTKPTPAAMRAAKEIGSRFNWKFDAMDNAFAAIIDRAMAGERSHHHRSMAQYFALQEAARQLAEACKAVEALVQCDPKMDGSRYYFRTSRAPDVHEAITLVHAALESYRKVTNE